MAIGSLGDLVVSLSADTAKFQSDLGKARRATDVWVRDVSKAFGIVAGALAAIGGAKGFASMVKGAIDSADAMNKLSQKLGVATEELSRYQYAAKLADVSNEQLQTGFQQLAKNQADFVAGTGEAKLAFDALGISQEQVKALNGDTAKLFELVAGKLASFADGANKTALAMKIFGRSGAELIPLINSLEEGSKEADKFGAIIGKDTAAAAERFNDNLTKLGLVTDRLALSLAEKLLPALEGVTNRMVEGSKKGEPWLAFLKEELRLVLAIADNLPVISTFTRPALIAMQSGQEAAKGFQASVRAIDNALLESKAAPAMRDVAAETRAAAKAAKEAEEAFKNYLNLFEFQEDVQREANEATNEYFKKQGELNAAAAEDQMRMWQQVFETIDMANQKAMEQGQILIEGPSHTDKLEEFQQSLLTEEELEIEAHEKRMERLQEFSDAELELMGGKHALMQQMEAQHQAKLLGIEMKKHETVRQMEIGTFQLAAGLLQKFAGESKAAAVAVIAIEKGLAIAQIQVNTAVAVMRAFAELGPVAGAAAAAKIKALGALQTGLVLASGLVEVGQVASGGGAPSVGLPPTQGVTVSPSGSLGGTPSQSGPTTIIQIKGNDSEQISLKQARQLLKSIEEATRDGGRVVLA